MTAVKADASEAVQRIRRLRQGVGYAMRQAIEFVVGVAFDSAKGTTLFKDRTGQTRASIRQRTFGLNGEVSAGGAARWLEFRTNGARPFMTEARTRAQNAADQAVHLFVNQAIEGFGG